MLAYAHPFTGFPLQQLAHIRVSIQLSFVPTDQRDLGWEFRDYVFALHDMYLSEHTPSSDVYQLLGPTYGIE